MNACRIYIEQYVLQQRVLDRFHCTADRARYYVTICDALHSIQNRCAALIHSNAFELGIRPHTIERITGAGPSENNCTVTFDLAALSCAIYWLAVLTGSYHDLLAVASHIDGF